MAELGFNEGGHKITGQMCRWLPIFLKRTRTFFGQEGAQIKGRDHFSDVAEGLEDSEYIY